MTKLKFVLALSLVLLSTASITAATSTWTGAVDTWFTNAANWSPAFPASGDDIVLGASSTIDLTGWNGSTLGAAYCPLGALTFNSSMGAELIDFGFDPGLITLGGDITQAGNGDITNSFVAYDLGTAVRSFKATGSGKINFNNGSIASTAGILIDSGYYVFRNVNGSFSGLTISAGGTAELSIDFGNLILPAAGTPSSIGTGQILTLDGGSLVLNSDDPLGIIGSFTDRGLLFTQNGGQAKWMKSSTSGGPAGFRFDTTNGQPAVLVGDFLMDGAWPADRGVMLKGVCEGSGDVLMILTNGALGYIVGSPTATIPFGTLYLDPANPLTNAYSKLDITLTIAGQPNGDPDADFSSTEVSRFETGNFGNSWNTTYHTNGGNLQLVAGGIHTRNVVQFYQRHTNPRFWGSDFTVEDGITVFCGGGGTGNSRQFYLGKDSSATLTIKNGATAVFNQQIRSDSVFQGGRLNATSDIQAGGTLVFKKSYPGTGGPIVVTGPILGKGNGSTGKESTLIIDLPYAREVAGRVDAAYTDPVTFFPGGSSGGGTLLDDWTSPDNTTGVKFYDGYANLVITATAPNILGLRVQGYSEFLTNLLTEARLNAVTGTAGVLTIAITNDATYVLSAGPIAPSTIAIGFDNAGANAAEYTVPANTTATNWQRLVVRNAVVKVQDGYVSPAQNVRALGGTLALNDASSVSVGQLVISENFTIHMGTAGGAGTVLAFAPNGNWTAGKTLTIANWNGGVYGGGPDQILIGSAGNLSPTQLAQVKWINPFGAGDVTGAIQLPTGEIVPPAGQSFLTAPAGGGSSDFQFSVTGVPGQTYVVEQTLSLTPPIIWTRVATNSGSFLFIDAGSAGAPVGFYRVTSQ